MHNLYLKSKIKRSKIILSYSFNFKSLRKSPLGKNLKEACLENMSSELSKFTPSSMKKIKSKN